MKVDIYRSNEWIMEQSVLRGQNVPQCITVEVNPLDLSAHARKIILDGPGYTPPRYPDHLKWITFNSQFKLYGFDYVPFGRKELCVDSDNPSPKEIEKAFFLAFGAITQDREEAERARLEREEQERQKKLEREEQERKLREARELLAKELTQLEQMRADRLVLAKFLAEVPLDALRGTLKRLTASEEALRAFQEKIEDASPVVIFDDEEDDDDES